jgi:hypothetical protein
MPCKEGPRRKKAGAEVVGLQKEPIAESNGKIITEGEESSTGRIIFSVSFGVQNFIGANKDSLHPCGRRLYASIQRRKRRRVGRICPLARCPASMGWVSGRGGYVCDLYGSFRGRPKKGDETKIEQEPWLKVYQLKVRSSTSQRNTLSRRRCFEVRRTIGLAGSRIVSAGWRIVLAG